MDDEVQRFSATSGRVLGVLALLLAAAAVVTLLRADDPAYAGVALAVLFGALAWAALLRPRLELDASRLVMHNMLSTVTLPLAAIESVVVRQVLVVLAGDKRYTSPAIGRSRRQLHRESRAGRSGFSGGGFVPTPDAGEPVAETRSTSYGLFVEERLRTQMSDARDRAGVRPRSPEQAALAEEIQRRPAVVEIAVLVVSLVAFVVLLAL